jgi:hypothetical protein
LNEFKNLLLSVGKLGHGATLSKMMGLVRC